MLLLNQIRYRVVVMSGLAFRANPTARRSSSLRWKTSRRTTVSLLWNYIVVYRRYCFKLRQYKCIFRGLLKYVISRVRVVTVYYCNGAAPPPATAYLLALRLLTGYGTADCRLIPRTLLYRLHKGLCSSKKKYKSFELQTIIVKSINSNKKPSSMNSFLQNASRTANIAWITGKKVGGLNFGKKYRAYIEQKQED